MTDLGDRASSLLAVTSYGGFGLVSATVLLVCLRVFLPLSARPKQRMVWLLFGLHLLVVGVRAVVPEGLAAARPVGLLAVFLLLTAISRGLFLLVADSVLGQRLGRPLPKIFRDILQGLMYAAVLLLTLQAAGVEPGSLLTTSALLTAVVGLSLQETLGNLFAGLAIQAQNPFEVGDWIQFDPDGRLVGRVIEINWRATKVLTHEEIEVIVPNSTLAKAPIRNYSKPTTTSRRSITFSCPYEVPPRRVKDTIEQALAGAPGVLPEPPPSVLVTEFAESAVLYEVRYFMADFQRRGPIDSEVRERTWYALHRARIATAYPVRQVRQAPLTDGSPGSRSADQLRDGARSLRAVDLFAALPDDAIARLAGLLETRLYGAGEWILRQGDAGDELFLVERGEVKVMVGRAGGSTAELTRLGPGKFFGEMSLMTGEKRSATIQASSECELLVVRKEAFQQILAASPHLAEQITETLLARQEQLDEHLASRRARAAPGDDEPKRQLLSKIRQFFAL